MDRIKVFVSNNDKLEQVIKNNEAAIAGKVLADEVVYGKDCALSKEWNINGEKVNLGVEKN